VTAQLQGPHNGIVTRFVREIAGYRGPLYVGDKVWVRFFVPHDHYMENRKLFSTRVGHLRTQNPHRDSWVTNPVNSIAIWFAIGRVLPGNGMLFYPGYWGRPVDHPNYEGRALRIDPHLSIRRIRGLQARSVPPARRCKQERGVMTTAPLAARGRGLPSVSSENEPKSVNYQTTQPTYRHNRPHMSSSRPPAGILPYPRRNSLRCPPLQLGTRFL